MSRMWRNKKAITPVLSNILLMAIAVAGMSIAIVATYVITDNLHDTMGERFVAEDVWFKSGSIVIYLRNTGKMPIDAAAVYVDHMMQLFTPLHLDPLEHGWLNITFTWTTGTVYYIRIATGRGTQIADYFRSPT